MVLGLAVIGLVFLLYQTATSDRPSRAPSLVANPQIYVSARKKWDDFNRDSSIRALTLSDAEINSLLAKAPEIGFLAGGATVTSRENGIQLQLSVPVKIVPFYTKYINADVFLRPIVTGVRMADYWDLVSGSPDEKRAKGWCIALYPLVLETLISIPNSERAMFIFEEQFEYQPYADRVMNAVAEYPDDRLRTGTGLSKLADWDFLPKQMTTLTQPADYLAFSFMSF